MAAVTFIIFFVLDKDVLIYCHLCCFFQLVARCLPSVIGKVSNNCNSKRFHLPCGMDAHNIYKWIILSTLTRGVRDMTCSYLLSLYSIYLSFFPPITHLGNLSIVPVFWINFAKPVSESHLSHCRCLGMLPKNVPKHRYCLAFLPQLNLLPFGL